MLSINNIVSGYSSSPAKMGPNPVYLFVMQSQINTDNLIIDFEKAIRNGANPNNVKNQIFADRNISEDDLTYSDSQRLIKEVENIYKSNQTRR